MKILNCQNSLVIPFFSIITFALCLALCGNAPAQVIATKYFLVQYPEAKCNDGSPAAFYLREAMKPDGTQADNWVIHFKGGATCNSEESCRDRRANEPEKTSSLDIYHLPFANFTDFGIFMVLRDAFPDEPFNEVRTIYCSSDGYTGHNTHRFDYDGNDSVDEDWFIRGQAITRAIIEELVTNHGMNNANRVVISGSSAGASSVKANAISIFEYLLAETSIFFGVATWDGNWRVEYRPYAKDNTSPQWTNEVAIARATFAWFGTSIDQECIDQHGTDENGVVFDVDPDICYPLSPVFKQNKLFRKLSTFVSARSEDSVSTPAYAFIDLLGYETAWASEMVENVDGVPEHGMFFVSEEDLTAHGLPENEAKKIVKEIDKGKMLRHGFHGMDDTIHIPYENIQMTTLGITRDDEFITIEDAFLDWIRQTLINLEDKHRVISGEKIRVMDEGLLDLVP